MSNMSIARQVSRLKRLSPILKVMYFTVIFQPNAKGPTPKNTPIKGTSTPPKPTKSPRAAAKVPTIIEEEDTLMEGRRTRKMNSRSKNLTRMVSIF